MVEDYGLKIKKNCTEERKTAYVVLKEMHSGKCL